MPPAYAVRGGLALDSSGNLYVADDENNRVLKYNSAFSGDTTADVVLGQSDFAHSDRNKVDASGFGGDTADINAIGLLDISALGTVAIDNSVIPSRIYVADTHNNRVLGFNNATSFVNGAPAAIVIGQPDFFTGTSKACVPNAATSSTLCSPTGVAVDAQGNLYVADNEDHRVLKFLAPVTTGKAASLVIGQPNFSANRCNGGLAAPTAASLCSPWSLALDASENLYVVDLTNNRVVAYTKPTTNHPNAVQVFGQAGFTTGTCNQPGLNKFSLCEPTAVAVDSMGRLFVADFDNSRVLRYTMPLHYPSPTWFSARAPRARTSAPTTAMEAASAPPRSVTLRVWRLTRTSIFTLPTRPTIECCTITPIWGALPPTWFSARMDISSPAAPTSAEPRPTRRPFRFHFGWRLITPVTFMRRTRETTASFSTRLRWACQTRRPPREWPS
jgi:sugar lactone lactonase YvrE